MITVVGFISQSLFFFRTLLQWVLSEKARKVLSPDIYWVVSIIASWLFFIYGWCRSDFSILIGQLITYYVYIWNLKETGVWWRIPAVIKAILKITPVLVLLYILANPDRFFFRFLANRDISLWLLILGLSGQVLFSLRFIYQWMYSLSNKESVLPVGFWFISLAGSGIILVYGILRLDAVLVMGQAFGVIAYWRNIIIHRNEFKYS